MPQTKPADQSDLSPQTYHKTRRGKRAGKTVAVRDQAFSPPIDHSLNYHIDNLLYLEKTTPNQTSTCTALFDTIAERIKSSEQEKIALTRLLMIIPFDNAVSTEKACLLYMLAAQLDIDNQKSPFNNAIQAARFFSTEADTATLFRQIAPYCTGSDQDTLIERINEIEMPL